MFLVKAGQSTCSTRRPSGRRWAGGGSLREMKCVLLPKSRGVLLHSTIGGTPLLVSPRFPRVCNLTDQTERREFMNDKNDNNTTILRTFLALGAGSLLASFARRKLGLVDVAPPEQGKSRKRTPPATVALPEQGNSGKRTPTTTVPAPKRR